jgi:hypothetical protein
MRFVRSNWLVEVAIVLALTIFFLLLSATVLPVGGNV